MFAAGVAACALSGAALAQTSTLPQPATGATPAGAKMADPRMMGDAKPVGRITIGPAPMQAAVR